MIRSKSDPHVSSRLTLGEKNLHRRQNGYHRRLRKAEDDETEGFRRLKPQRRRLADAGYWSLTRFLHNIRLYRNLTPIPEWDDL